MKKSDSDSDLNLVSSIGRNSHGVMQWRLRMQMNSVAR